MKFRLAHLLFLLLGISVKTSLKAQQRPNIIVILSDDMGYSDIGCYGSEIHTPNLDQLAAGGIRFSQFYNGARCCPTRASLLTGLYPHQAGMGWMRDTDYQLPGYRGDLNPKATTIAEVARSAGYSTFLTGKWHVSQNINDDGPKTSWPLQRGFDRYYGTIQGAGSYFDPAALCRDNHLISPFRDAAYKTDSFYYTDAITHEAIRFIKERDASKPFFLYVTYTAAHWPLHAKPADIAKYKGKYDKGWDVIRDARFNKLRHEGLISNNTELAPADYPGWNNGIDKAVQAARMEVYAAIIDDMDQGIGAIREALKQQGIDNNTVIMYMQDNGGCAEDIGATGATGNWAQHPETLKPLKKEEISYATIPHITRDGKLVQKGKGVSGGPDSTYISYGKSWANVSNTPFREYKHWVHEGGIATPLIINYPGVTNGKNKITPFVGHIIDIMPTIVELTGAKYEGSIPLEGVSLVPLLKGKSLDRGKALCWEHEMNRAVRLGDWKLVSKGELLKDKAHYRQGKWELYNMKKDRSELHDLAELYPEKVQELSAIWNAYANRVGVFPSPWKPLMDLN